MSKGLKKSTNESATLDRIKRIGVVAMFSDDELLEELVLKGGNAMALVHKMSSRASVDLDFSMKHDFPDGEKGLLQRAKPALERSFQEAGYRVFDLKVESQPGIVSEAMATFWGGYGIEFKLVSQAVFDKFKDDIENLRRNALNLGKGTKFLIDISRFEYIDGKQAAEFDGYQIYVYTPLMIACEKLRAICQQMVEYGPIVKRLRPGSSRARDFFDLFILIREFKLDLTSQEALATLKEMFNSKHVPLDFLQLMPNQKPVHVTSVQSLKDTLEPGVEWKGFDFYFDYVVQLSLEVHTALDAKV